MRTAHLVSKIDWLAKKPKRSWVSDARLLIGYPNSFHDRAPQLFGITNQPSLSFITCSGMRAEWRERQERSVLSYVWSVPILRWANFKSVTSLTHPQLCSAPVKSISPRQTENPAKTSTRLHQRWAGETRTLNLCIQMHTPAVQDIKCV